MKRGAGTPLKRSSGGKSVKRIMVLLGLILVAGLAATSYVSSTSSAGFTEKNGDVVDDWGICRTRADGEDGFYQISETSFRPVIAFESLGESTALAYSLGEQIAGKYPDQLQRAQAVFHLGICGQSAHQSCKRGQHFLPGSRRL